MSGDYFIGVNAAEIDRLRTQHEAWRPETESLWADAGFSSMRSVMDLGCGPGFTSLDLARVVGVSGSVRAVDKAASYLTYLADHARAAGLANVTTMNADLTTSASIDGRFDGGLLSLVSRIPQGRFGRCSRQRPAVAAPGWHLCGDGVSDAPKRHLLSAQRRVRREHTRVDRVLRPTRWRHVHRCVAAIPTDTIRFQGSIAQVRRRHGQPTTSMVGMVGPID